MATHTARIPYRYSLELENGELAQPMLYLSQIMKPQDLGAWQHDPDALNTWVRKQMADYFDRCSVVIRTRNPLPE